MSQTTRTPPYDQLDPGQEPDPGLPLGDSCLDNLCIIDNPTFFFEAFDLVPAPVFIKDLEGVYRLCNRVFADQILGLPRQLILGRTLFELNPQVPAELARKYHEMDLSLLDFGGSQRYIGTVQCADDRLRTFEFRKTVIRDSHGQIAGLIGVMLDISARVRAEEKLADTLSEAQHLNAKLKRQQALLVETEKLASLGRFAEGVAHEINNPLSFIKGNLATLGDYVTAMSASLSQDAAQRPLETAADLEFMQEDSQQVIAECLEGVVRIQEIVHGLLGLARPDDDQPVATDPASLIEAVLVVARGELTQHRELQADLQDAQPIVCYPQQIERVVLNLLINAAQATSAAGKIMVTLGDSVDGIRITIADDGTGIPRDRQARIFDPFYTTRPVGQGAGLGLHVVQTIVNRHGGHIELQSEEGEGTSVTVTLPYLFPSV
jgi:two-component system, NtrC family, sensor kinase